MTATFDSEISQQVFELLVESEPLKARDIATRLDVQLKDVNQALYGNLSHRVGKDGSYRWRVVTGAPRAAATRTPKRSSVRATRKASKSSATVYIPGSGGRALTGGTSQLRKALQLITDETQREMNLTQILMLLRIAEGEPGGVDAGRLAEDVGASPAAVSRTIRILGRVHYTKKHAGFGLVEFEVDPTDNRRRVARLSPAGRVLVHRVLAALG